MADQVFSEITNFSSTKFPDRHFTETPIFTTKTNSESKYRKIGMT